MADLSGQIWLEINSNGVIDGGETLAQDGWVVGLYEYTIPTVGGGIELGTEVATSETSGGSYSFTGVANGNYAIVIIDTDNAAGNQNLSVAANPNLNQYMIPVAPLVTLTGAAVYLANVTDSGVQISGTDFENAPDLVTPTDDHDLGANQIYEDDGFRFWEGSIGNSGAYIEGEDKDGVDANPWQSIGDAFVSDLQSTARDNNGREFFDLVQPGETGMGEYFVRAGGIGAQSDYPALVIEYLTPTKAASGLIYDIDAFYTQGNSYSGSEQWLITAYDENGVEVDSTESVLGEAVWVKANDTSASIANGTNDANSNTLYGTTAADITYSDLVANDAQMQALVGSTIGGRFITQELADMVKDKATKKSNGDYKYYFNPHSYDGRGWQWTLESDSVDIASIEITYSGYKLNPNNVGVAFDDFRAFGNSGDLDFLIDGAEPSQPDGVIIEAEDFNNNFGITGLEDVALAGASEGQVTRLQQGPIQVGFSTLDLDANLNTPGNYNLRVRYYDDPTLTSETATTTIQIYDSITFNVLYSDTWTFNNSTGTVDTSDPNFKFVDLNGTFTLGSSINYGISIESNKNQGAQSLADLELAAVDYIEFIPASAPI